MRKVFRAIAILALLAVIGLSGFKLWEILAQTADESTIKKEMSVFRPQMLEVQFTGLQTGDSDVGNVAMLGQEEPEPEPELEPVPQINQGIIDMQNEVNPIIRNYSVPCGLYCIARNRKYTSFPCTALNRYQ